MVVHWVENNSLSSLQTPLSFSDPIQRSDGDGRGGREVKEPFCSPQHRAGLGFWGTAQCKRDNSAGDGPGCGRKMLQRLSIVLLQAFVEGIPNQPDMRREGRVGCYPPKGLKDPSARGEERFMEK